MRILGIDYGKKKIGLAFAESDVKLALPLDVVPNLGAQTIMEIAKRIRVDDIDLVVIGMPGAVSSHGNEKQIAVVKSFIAELQKQTAVPIVEEDESFTTAESHWDCI